MFPVTKSEEMARKEYGEQNRKMAKIMKLGNINMQEKPIKSRKKGILREKREFRNKAKL